MSATLFDLRKVFYVTTLLLNLCHNKVIGFNLDENVIPELYRGYLEAVNDNVTDTGKNIESSRRLLKNDKYYSVHIKKLKEVNGLKTHNLMIKGTTRSNDTIIYINNPVESKIPNSFLTIEEFKRLLIGRIDSKKDAYGILYPKPKSFNNKKVISNKASSGKTESTFTNKNIIYKNEEKAKSISTTKKQHATKRLSTLQYKVRKPFTSETTVTTNSVTLQPQKVMKSKVSEERYNVATEIRNSDKIPFITPKKSLLTTTLKLSESNKTVQIGNNQIIIEKNNVSETYKNFQPHSDNVTMLINIKDTTAVNDQIKINKFGTEVNQTDQNLSKTIYGIVSLPAVSDIDDKQISTTQYSSTNPGNVRIKIRSKENNLTQIKNITNDTEKPFDTKMTLIETHNYTQPVSTNIVILSSSTDSTTVIDQSEITRFGTNINKTNQESNKTLHEIASVSVAIDTNDKQINTTKNYATKYENVRLESITDKNLVEVTTTHENSTKTSTKLRVRTKSRTKRTRGTYARPRVFFGGN